MSKLRAVKSRIKTAGNIQQITKAMKMVAAARLRKAQASLMSSRPYAALILEDIQDVAASDLRVSHPLLESGQGEKLCLVMITGDKGLCGSFNSNLLKRADSYLKEHRDKQVEIIALGRKANDYLRRLDRQPLAYHADIFKNISYPWGAGIGEEIVDLYLSGEYSQVVILYNEFKSVAQQNIVVEGLLPVVPAMPKHLAAAQSPAEATEKRIMVDYLFEPSAKDVLGELCPLFVKARVYHALLESLASEMGARMSAMENATRSAGEMIDTLTLVYNKARQAAITKEIMEVVSGAEALS
jgi:F-type H+-transporting ATPase subunit gamma